MFKTAKHLETLSPLQYPLTPGQVQKIMSEYKYSFQENSKKTLKEKLYHHTPKDLDNGQNILKKYVK